MPEIPNGKLYQECDFKPSDTNRSFKSVQSFFKKIYKRNGPETKTKEAGVLPQVGNTRGFDLKLKTSGRRLCLGTRKDTIKRVH